MAKQSREIGGKFVVDDEIGFMRYGLGTEEGEYPVLFAQMIDGKLVKGVSRPYDSEYDKYVQMTTEEAELLVEVAKQKALEAMMTRILRKDLKNTLTREVIELKNELRLKQDILRRVVAREITK